MSLQVGSRAPYFSLPSDKNTIISLDDYTECKLILYFYPKDDTPGCTIEALDFTACLEQFKKHNTAILGVSTDSPTQHEKFIHKHHLKISLLSDENKEVAQSYKVWVEKNMYGRKYMGIERTSFFIDENKIIQHIWHKVRVKGHVSNVLQEICR